MIEHLLEHSGKPVPGHSLISIRKVTIITVRTRGHPRSHCCIKLRRIDSPLFARVIPKKLFVYLATNFTDHNILRRSDGFAGLRDRLKELVNSKRSQVQAIQRVDCVEVNWNRHNLSVD